MTATQAPTPGPLSEGWTGRKCPTCNGTGQRSRDPMGPCMACGGTGDEYGSLAPTAPVEASGPERETVFDVEAHDLVQTAQALAIAIERVPDWLMNDNLLTAHCHAQVLIADLPAALHPQPSGETREAVARIIHRNEFEGQAWEDATEAYRQHVLKTASDILSARPLALDLVSPRTFDLGRVDDDVAALSTPARAEAQDEGAAGEPVAWQYRHPDCQWGDMGAARISVGAPAVNAPSNFECRALYTHPSPPPAADEDRVRIAVETLERWASGSGSPPKGEIRSTLAALKSTAAKEGGAL